MSRKRLQVPRIFDLYEGEMRDATQADIDFLVATCAAYNRLRGMLHHLAGEFEVRRLGTTEEFTAHVGPIHYWAKAEFPAETEGTA